MSLTVSQSQAVYDLLRWLAGKPPQLWAGDVDGRAIGAMELLVQGAYKTMQVKPDGDLPARIVDRLRAADSDGAAQAVCRVLDQQFRGVVLRQAVALPADLRRTLDEWRRLQDSEMGERLRDQTAGSIDTAWGTVDV